MSTHTDCDRDPCSMALSPVPVPTPGCNSNGIEINLDINSHSPDDTSTSTTSSLISSKRKKCVNISCPNGRSSDYPQAPTYAVNYYGIDSSNKSKVLYICRPCLEKAEEYLQESITALQEKKCYLNLTTGILDEAGVVVDLADEDDSRDSPGMSMSLDFAENLVEMLDMEDMDEDPSNVVQDYLSSLNVETQVGICANYLEDQITKLDEDFDVQELILDNCEAQIERIRKTLEEHVGPEYNSVILRSVEIQEDGRVCQLAVDKPTNSNSLAPQEIISTLANKELIAKLRPMPKVEPSSSIAIKEERVDDEIQEVVPKDFFKNGSKLKETPKVLPRMIPGLGRPVYVMRINQLSYWAKGKILDVFPSKTGLSLKEYKVLIEGTKKTPPQTKIVTGKHIAFNVPAPFILPVGTRVIARFDDDLKSQGEEEYYAGIIAERPVQMNNFRYLIFFDDGCAQYIDCSHVLWVCESSPNVWEDVYPDSQDFIRRYVGTYPERPMVRLTEGQIITTEWNGTWNFGRVVEVDGSLAKFYFELDRRYEWIYRGSTRLLPLWIKEMKHRQQSFQARGKSRRHRLNPNEPLIEYKYLSGDLVTRDRNKDLPYSYVPLPLEKTPVKFTEYEGKMVKSKIPEEIKGPAKYVVHECGPHCVRPYDESKAEYKGVSPLQLPFYLGFARETIRVRQRNVSYKAPCGKILRNIDEMYEYLKLTNYNLGIDHFCFDFAVDVMNEFTQGKTYYTIEDCSFGGEVTPIKCVNAVDNDFPETMTYSKSRIPSQGVPLNLDPEFLSCCDCEDDCSDKEKCACWQMTIQGVKANPSIAETFEHQEIGYQHRRLMEHVTSGIYECNTKCKCKKTCFNRVVQHDLKWPLQLFKTLSKGWALRPLYDIPIGSFICNYAGEILTDQQANLQGRTFGDEYFAELDFIEVMESTKEGYEDEAFGPGLDKAVKGTKRNSDEHAKRKKLNDASIPIRTRELFGEEECFIMDAKTVGNIGRYLNHSCSPNVMVQNVFVDTHDLRFPWVAFFAFKHIKAGTELTWDYSYDIGSVDEKKMYCQCGAPECRGRLL